MKLTLAEPKYLKESISIISELVTEARFKVKKDAIELIAMDPANVAMVIFKLLNSCFTEYDVGKDQEIAINLNNLRQILRRVGPNDMLSLESTSDNKLQIQIKGASTRTFSLPLIDLEDKEQKIPDLNFGVNISTSASILNDAIDDAGIVADSVTFLAESARFTINAEGDLNKAKIDVKPGDETKITIDGSDVIKAKYSIEYLKKIIAGSKLSDIVEINFNNDYPLKIDYRVVDRMQMSFILAPRVEND